MEHTFPVSLLLVVFTLYTVLLFLVSWLTSRKSDSNSFFSGNKKSPWPIVAYGMVGTSISGVTYTSVPGNVMNENFYYMPLVLGFVLGYVVIAKVLLPLYYRMQVTSIYSYLEHRFGFSAYRTGAAVFMISRILGAAVRIFIVVLVLFTFFPAGTVPFWCVAAVFMLLIFLYTVRGGVKTIIWTDVLQTTLMLLAVVLTVVSICKAMDWNLGQMTRSVVECGYSAWFNWDWSSSNNAVKQFISGIFITIAMTGLDQEMMQKNLSCKDLRSAQKNIYTTSITIVVVNILFLLLGAVLSLFVSAKLGGLEGIGLTASQSDKLFPVIASQYLGLGVGLFFIVGLISASYPSAGGALTSLTTSFCIDFLGFNSKRKNMEPSRKNVLRKGTHALFALLFFVIILVLYIVNNQAIINLVYLLAAYTYGPLLGLFFFGILTKRPVRDRLTPYIAVAAPVLTFVLDWVLKRYFDFGLGFTVLLVNGFLTFAGMWLARSPRLGKSENPLNLQ